MPSPNPLTRRSFPARSFCLSYSYRRRRRRRQFARSPAADRVNLEDVQTVTREYVCACVCVHCSAAIIIICPCTPPTHPAVHPHGRHYTRVYAYSPKITIFVYSRVPAASSSTVIVFAGSPVCFCCKTQFKTNKKKTNEFNRNYYNYYDEYKIKYLIRVRHCFIRNKTKTILDETLVAEEIPFSSRSSVLV